MLHHEIIGDGTPVVILHGVTLDHRSMVDICEPVFEAHPGWRRVYVDLPGHGQSPPQDSIASQDDLLAAVMAFVDQRIGEAPFGLIGYSRGSYIARGIVFQRPAQVTGVALIAPGGNFSSPHALPPHETLEVEPGLHDTCTDEERRLLDTLIVAQRADVIARWRQSIRPARKLHDIAQESRVKASFDFTFHALEMEQVFDGPSLILAGRQDCMSGYLDAMDIARRYRRATLAILDAAGHMAPWERREAYEAHMADWLCRLAEAAS